MKTFRFRLERALELREKQLRAEEAALDGLLNRRGQMLAEMNQLEASLHQARVCIQQQPFVRAAELVSLDRYNGRVARERQQWQSKLAAHDQMIDEQKTKLVAARGRFRLLEKLREKQKLEWQAGADRELEELAADFSAAQWLRLAGQS